METRSIKLLLLCLIFVSLIFFGIGFAGEEYWYTGFFCFIVNILLLIGFIMGIMSPPQPMIYMIACFVEGFFVIISFALAILWFVWAGQTSLTVLYVIAVFNLLDAFICGTIAFFSFQVWKLGG
uniref:MARVEL domain-containing protein n=1 Tax=Panagrolaimus sp. PS1159 TaxID=55785 RepID=A0AC35FZL6_9BILA